MNIDFSPNKDVSPKKGQVLLSEPFLNDPYFKRTVILLCEHNDEGSFGFVLNNYIDVELDQIMEEMPKFNSKISIGGPVRNSNLYYLHTLGNRIEESLEILPGVFMGGDFNLLKKMLVQGEIRPEEVRFFVGYSGWSPGQLKAEIETSSWFVADVDAAMIMNTDVNDLWKVIMKKFGRRGEIIANMPEDPSLN